MKSDGNEKRRLLSMEEGSEDIAGEWNKDGKLLAFTTNVGGLNQPGIFNFENEEINLLGEAKYEEYASVFTKDSKKLVCLRNYEAAIEPVIYDLESGECQVLEFPKGIVGGYEGFRAELAMNDELLTASFSSSTIPSSLIAYNFKTSK